MATPGFLGGLGSLLGGGTTPEEQQRAAIFKAGLATLAGAQQPGASFGGALFGGLQAGAGVLQQAQQNALQDRQLKAREEREQRLDKAQIDRDNIASRDQARKDRQLQADAGYRGGKGLLASKNPLNQFQLVSRDPDFGAALTGLGIDPASITTPEQVSEVANQLVSLGELSAKPGQQPSIPADIASYEFYRNLPPDQQKQFENLKRNQPPPYRLSNLAGSRIAFNSSTGEYEVLSTPQNEFDAAAERARRVAEANASGKNSVTLATKQPVLDRFNYSVGQIRAQIDETLQGGPLGIFGKAGSVFDYGDAARFDSIKENLSTDLRAAFRIPGEGTLTDQEQRQYGLQLPSRNFPPGVNKAIVDDLEARMRITIGDGPARPQQQPTRPIDQVEFSPQQQPAGRPSLGDIFGAP